VFVSIVVVLGSLGRGVTALPAATASTTRFVTTPTPAVDGGLTAVAAPAPDEVWSVGYKQSACENVTTVAVIDRWDGSAWTEATSGPCGVLRDVSASGPTDVWAVGNDNDVQPLIQHWDGTAWTTVAPGVGSGELFGVAALTPDDAWAVGTTSTVPNVPLVEHWDGTSWTAVTTPSLGRSGGSLTGVWANTATDIWVSGDRQSLRNHRRAALMEHWDGRAWSIVPAAAPPTPRSDWLLADVDGVSTGDVWAAGATRTGTGPVQTLLEHWDGAAWTIRPSDNGNARLTSALSGLAVGARASWAVGVTAGTNVFHPLLERLHSSGASRVSAGPSLGRVFAKAAFDPNGRLWIVGAVTYAHQDTTSETAGYIDP
jgi:hypothetical protein